MPLSFQSENRGNIAFGFFNIESDMLLLENYLFFADDFCELICKMANDRGKEDNKGKKQFQFKVYYIADLNDMGDLMGAIHGIHYTGFIGKIYKRFPFPENPSDFKQNPEGYKTRDIIKKEIEKVAGIIEISIDLPMDLTADISGDVAGDMPSDKNVHIGSYIFNQSVFHELLQYVDKGGYPRWKDEIRPDYVVLMKKNIQKSRNFFLKGAFAT